MQFPWEFRRFAWKSAETFLLQKTLSPTKRDKKASILHCERIEIIIHFTKNMAQHHFFIKKNKRPDMRLRKRNGESSLVANIL